MLTYADCCLQQNVLWNSLPDNIKFVHRLHESYLLTRDLFAVANILVDNQLAISMHSSVARVITGKS